MKRGARVLAIDDAPFTRGEKEVLVVGVVWRSGVVEGVLATRVRRDGSDATAKLAALANNSRFKEGLRLILLHSITLAGFNIVDIKKLAAATGVPVLTLVRRKPDTANVKTALRKFRDFKRRWALIERAGGIHRIGRFYCQFAGVGEREAKEALRQAGAEGLRLAHLIASGVTRGESRGRI
ncbi:MAG: DUF99 family protein [Candidatus Micrarchaeia archaeon]